MPVPTGEKLDDETRAKAQAARAAKLAARAKMTDAEVAQDVISRRLEKLARQLVQAALGQREFAELPPHIRLNATIKALEWGIGRPGQGRLPEAEEADKGLAVE